MTRAAVYSRISKDRAGAGLGVARQEADCRKLAEGRGWTVTDTFTDNDLSAYSGKRRPEYERLLTAIEAKAVDAIVAWHPDRLHRSTVELERFIDVVERTGIKIATVQAGELDLSTPSGRMVARMLGAAARHEVEHKAERQRRKAEELARSGKMGGGGTRPYGFEADRRTIKRDEAKIVKEIAKRVLAGDTLRGVVVDLNKRGVPTVTGTPWSMPVVRRLLIAPRTAGLREYRGVVVANAEWPAIVSRADHERLVKILTDPSRRTSRTARTYLLAGIAECGLCDARLVSRPRSDKARCYVCASGPQFGGCGKIRVLADPLEEMVVEMVLTATDTPGLTSRLSRTVDDPEDLGEIVTLERRLEELATEWADGGIDRRSWLAARNRIEDKLEAAHRAVASQTSTSALAGLTGAGALRKAWPDLGFDRQRAVVAAIMDRVVVHPAIRGLNRFDERRVSPVWRA
jgi:site-specific DNA recombinase